jgi:hypothetical protein
MTTSVGDHLIERLRDWGVKHVFVFSTVLKGDPNAWHLVYQGAKTKAQELIPH